MEINLLSIKHSKYEKEFNTKLKELEATKVLTVDSIFDTAHQDRVSNILLDLNTLREKIVIDNLAKHGITDGVYLITYGTYNDTMDMVIDNNTITIVGYMNNEYTVLDNIGISYDHIKNIRNTKTNKEIKCIVNN